MPIENWTVIRDGITHRFTADFEIVANCVELCPICGNACTGVISVWYLTGQKRLTVRVDRGNWDSLFDVLIQDAIEKRQYSNLPSFLRERNEMTGWCANTVMDGAMISPEEVLAAIALIQAMEAQLPPQSLALLGALHHLAANAIAGGYSCWAWDD